MQKKSSHAETHRELSLNLVRAGKNIAPTEAGADSRERRSDSDLNRSQEDLQGENLSKSRKFGQ